MRREPATGTALFSGNGPVPVIFLALLLLAPGAQAFINERTEYYSIYGNTHSVLVAEIDQKGPNGFTGYTYAEFAYQYRTSSSSTGCRVSSLQVDVDITYTMPRWEDRDSANAELRASWDASYAALERHEKQHGAISKQTHNEIIREVRRIGARNSCGEIGGLVASAFNSALASHSEQQRNYDQTTEHGRLEGSTFRSIPPASARPAFADASPTAPGSTDSSNVFWYFLGALIVVLLYLARRS